MHLFSPLLFHMMRNDTTVAVWNSNMYFITWTFQTDDTSHMHIAIRHRNAPLSADEQKMYLCLHELTKSHQTKTKMFKYAVQAVD